MSDRLTRPRSMTGKSSQGSLRVSPVSTPTAQDNVDHGPVVEGAPYSVVEGEGQMSVPIVVMGVAGCGKSTIGELLATRLGVPYAEADDFHPSANVAKMQAGIPLTDVDRGPWLAAIADRIAAGADAGLVVSCSALKRGYRDVLRRADHRAFFVHLVLDEQVALARVGGRGAHFMPASLVASQFAALEPLRDEAGLAVDATLPATVIIDAVLAALPDAPRQAPGAITSDGDGIRAGR